ncbi:50S ribosomal protein L10 [Microvirga sp. STR05]|uniref:Large ribosomal subunit protein uL10 n=2 Tax=Hymenobacter TaxID=89966 RepID=A0A7G7W933_9BACT|nr:MULTISPECIES: 50S ribosomal protein L10 [Hymenobacter]MBD2714415.1 50S ribosomal protein L10 [Hymenobacter duratus]MBR7949319.1 50S ribosomal protein L10 [Microvirga sp. STR05]QNH62876.1 50S ribosomal protein L10 [Hymenobacter sediminicola]
MIREEKQALVDELSEKFQSHNAFYIADASGMSVAKINEFRRLCFTRGMEFKVYKNTFIRKALDTLGGDTSEMDAALKGQSGILFSKESGNAPAKLLQDFYKSQNYGKNVEPKPALKGAYVDAGIYIGANQLSGLSTLKGKNELIGDVIGLLQSPAKNVISALSSGGNKLAGIIKTLSEKEEVAG